MRSDRSEQVLGIHRDGKRDGKDMRPLPMFVAPWLSSDDRKDFYHAFSHIFRNPLVGAVGYMDYLFRGDSGNLTQEQMAQLGNAREAVLQLERVVDTLMDLVAFDMGLIQPQKKPINLNEFLNKFHGLKEWASAEKTQVSLFLPKTPLWIAGDEKWLRNLIYELLSNAVRVSPKRSPVRVELYQNQNYAVCCVEDKGPGVPPDRLNWIFQPLTQLRRQGDSPRGERGGLGLALSAHIIYNHGGYIWAELVRGGGLAVSMKFPLINASTGRESEIVVEGGRHA